MSEPRPPEDPDWLCTDCGARVADYVPEPDEEPFDPICGVCAYASHPMAGIRRPTRMLRDTDCDGTVRLVEALAAHAEHAGLGTVVHIETQRASAPDAARESGRNEG